MRVMTGAKRNDNLFGGKNALRCHFNVEREKCKAGNWNIQAAAVGLALGGGKRTRSAARLHPAATY